jgi:transposase
MIITVLSNEEKKQLKKYRSFASSENSEKALMVLLNAEGKSPIKIAMQLKRHQHTVRTWLKRYQNNGIKGLDRFYSPGRPNSLREMVKECIIEIIDKTPFEFGYQNGQWTVILMLNYLKTKKGLTTSEDTVERALKDLGYTYKRPSKSVSDKSPSKEEKAREIKNIIDEINELAKEKDCEIFALDETHFSTEPYIIRGWGKKRWPPEDSLSGQKRKDHILWMLESRSEKILLEKITIR